MYIYGSGVARKGGTGKIPPPKPRKFGKDKEQHTPQPEMSIDSKRKFKFLKIYLNIY